MTVKGLRGCAKTNSVDLRRPTEFGSREIIDAMANCRHCPAAGGAEPAHVGSLIVMRPASNHDNSDWSRYGMACRYVIRTMSSWCTSPGRNGR
jgi:hypothetical protein